jgi:hypothetical protein
MTTSGSSASGSDPGTARSDVAKQEAAEMAGTVKEQGGAVAGAAQAGGQRVVAEAASQVGQLGGQVQTQVKELLGRSQTEFTDRASEQTEAAAGQLHDVAGELQALVEGRPQDAPRVAGYVAQAAERVESYAGRLDRGGFSGVADDLGRFARRRPGAFLLGAIAAGFVAGRLARGAQAASGNDESSAEVSQLSPTPPPLGLDSAYERSGLPRPPAELGALDRPVTVAAVDPQTGVLPPSYLTGGPGGQGAVDVD